MSALGQKQTYAAQQVMSALPPKADIRCAGVWVQFAPHDGVSVSRGQGVTVSAA